MERNIEALPLVNRGGSSANYFGVQAIYPPTNKITLSGWSRYTVAIAEERIDIMSGCIGCVRGGRSIRIQNPALIAEVIARMLRPYKI